MIYNKKRKKQLRLENIQKNRMIIEENRLSQQDTFTYDDDKSKDDFNVI